jgi:DNA-binding NarL/FixJ family response regulator
MSEKINVVIADSQYLISEALKSILSTNYNVFGTVDNSYDLYKILKSGNIQILITDFALIDYESVNDLKKLKATYPALNILILTDSVKKEEISVYNKAGINHIIYKNVRKDELILAIEACLKGKKYYSEEVLNMLLEQERTKIAINKTVQLTNSEIEIVRLIADGQTTKMIADIKNISFHTVMTHRKNIFRKLEINSVSELLMYAVKNALIDTIEYHI